MGAEWTKEQTDQAVDLAKQGLSFSVIAKKVFPNGEKSRNAVIGRVHRVISAKDKKLLRTRRQANQDLAMLRRMQSRAKKKSIKVIKKSPVPKVRTNNNSKRIKPKPSMEVDLVNLTPNMCRAVTSDIDKPALFCGHEKQDGGSSYCKAHHLIYTAKRQNGAIK